MAIQLSIAARNARLDAIETTIGTSANLHLRTGAQPADCATADSGSLLGTLALPSDWLAAAASGAKAKAGTWSGTASGTGTIGHHRLKDSGNAATHLQGSCGTGSGDLSFDNAAVVSGQTITVNTYTLTDGNA